MVAQEQLRSVVNSNPRRVRRRLVPIAFSIPLLLVLAWGVYWYVAYRYANTYVIEGVLRSTETPVVACGSRQISGFPAQIRISCSDATVATNDAAAVSLGGFLVEAPLYNPGWAETRLLGPFAYEGTNHIVTADWTAAKVDLMAGFDGVTRANVALNGASLTITDFVDNANWAAAANIWTTDVHAANDDPNSMRVLLSANNLRIELDGVAYPSLTGDATLTVFESGDRFDRLPAVMMGDWLVSGGAFRIDHMSLSSGDLIAEITGSMQLEIDGTLSGNVLLRYAGDEDLPRFVSAIFPWLADDAQLIADAFAALSTPIELRGLPAHEVRLILDHGAVRIGFIPIPLSIPSIGPLDHFLRPAG